MSDYIKREDAINALCNHCGWREQCEEDCGFWCDTGELLRAGLSADVVPKDFHDKTCEAMAKRHTEEMQRYMWIPCSERLPSKDGMYLVTYPIIGNKLWVDTLWYGRPTFPETDHPCFYASDDEYGDVEYDDVVAWMPLPEPYREREGE